MITWIISHALSKIHTLLLSIKRGVSIDLSSEVYYKSRIINHTGRVQVGKSCKIGTSPKNYHGGMPFPTTLLCDGDRSEILIGNNCRLNGVYVHAQKRIVIGDNCVMASGVNIIDSNGHETISFDRTKGRDFPKEIIIGNNVWIGMNVIVLKGSVIEDNSIISAGSVVRGHVSANTIYSTCWMSSTRPIEFKTKETVIQYK